MTKKHNIYLVGFMGCGKSTFGKRLAKSLGFDFTDLDREFEKETKLTISEYFKLFGETEFRKKEKEILRETVTKSNSVIATGGGTPCFFDNMVWMNSNGLTLFLKTPVEELCKRLENSKSDRPLLKDRKGKELHNFIEMKLAEREKHYQMANLEITSQRISPGLLETLKKLIYC